MTLLLPPGPFTTIVADPPWPYRDKVHAGRVRASQDEGYTGTVKGRRGAEGYYRVMSLEEIAALPVASVVAENAHLYLWCTNAFLEQAHQVARAWGFQPKTVITWVKDGIGMGSYFRNCTEHVVFAVCGRLPVLRRNQRTVFHAAKSPRHSEKPEHFMQIVESMSPGPFLELFARRQRPGWTAWGDDVEGVTYEPVETEEERV